MPDGGFPIQIEHGLVEIVSRDLPSYAAFVAPEPFGLVEDRLVRAPAHVTIAGELELDALERLGEETAATGVEAVVGIGGGSAIDTAKFVAWRTGLALWQFPSIASVDAVFTRPAGVRTGRRVRYMGDVAPELVAVDLDLVLAAPPELNRAGAGDILSCHTGLSDWYRAVDAGADVPALDERLIAKARGWLHSLDENASVVAAAGPDAARFLMSTLREVGTTCDAAGFSYFEEGSEHYFAYCFEYLTGRHLVHGELVALGIVAMSIAQENDPDWVVDLLARLGVRWRPAELDIERATLVDVLDTLPAFCADELFAPSAASSLDNASRSAIIDRLV